MKDPEVRSTIRELAHKQGMSGKAIGTMLGISARTIQHYLQGESFNGEGTLILDSDVAKLDGDKRPLIGFGRLPTMQLIIDRVEANKQDEGAIKQPKVLFLDLEVSASIVAAFSMFKHFSTPDHVMQFPYILTFACNWLHEPEDKIYGYKLDDFETWDEDHRNDYELTCKLWKYLDEADVVVIQNSQFDDGWANQRFAYHGLPLPSPYRTICTLKGLKKSMSLPSNSLKYSVKYFNLGLEKLHNDGIELWIKCMSGDLQAMQDMLTYNIGDIPTLRRLYLTIRAFIPNHPNLALYYKDKVMRCSVCGGNHLTRLESKAVTNLSSFASYRCDDCGTVKRTAESTTTKEDRNDFLRNITK